jgi:hypothetical protein
MTASGARSDLPQAVIDLAQDDHAAHDREVASTPADGELALADLVSDAIGEVVLFNDSGFRTLAIRTESPVVTDGRVQKHVTAGGEDVSGFNYVTFGNGVTLYYPDGFDLILEGDAARPAG